MEEPATDRDDDDHVSTHEVEQQGVAVLREHVAEQVDKRYSTIGEAAVDESGPRASVVREPFADHIDAGGIDQSGAGPTDDRVADEGQRQVAARPDAEETETAQHRGDQHGSARRQNALLP